jgi:hypothetical protein
MDATETRPASPRFSWFRYRLRTLLVLMLLASVGMSWLGVQLRTKRKEMATVTAILELGGRVGYDAPPVGGGKRKANAPSPVPQWAQRLLRGDIFARVASVGINGEDILVPGLKVEYEASVNRGVKANSQAATALGSLASCPDLTLLASLSRLQYLKLTHLRLGEQEVRQLTQIESLTHLVFNSCAIDEAGLKELTKAKNLQYLKLNCSGLAPSSIEKLAAELPGCKVVR